MKALALDLDGVLGDTRPLWQAWLQAAARRFGTIAELDVAALPADRVEAARQLDRWAAAGVGDWRAALERFAADHAPVYLRPDADVAAVLRRLHAAGVALGAFTDAPEALANVALAHLGALRRLAAVETGDDALARLLERLGSDARVVRTRGELAALDPYNRAHA